MEPGEIVEKMRQNPLLRGITLTGGEPFLQPEGMAELAQIARDNGYDVVAYTGYKFEDLIQKGGGQSQIRSMLKLVDLLIDGLYEQADRRLELPFRGSLNQRLVLARQSLNEGKLVTLDESRLYEPFPSIHIMME
jgi:anaerobic ribonucleoside-triphosphate reductase activating protein